MRSIQGMNLKYVCVFGQPHKSVSSLFMVQVKGDWSLVPIHCREVTRHFLFRAPHWFFSIDSPISCIILRYMSMVIMKSRVSTYSLAWLLNLDYIRPIIRKYLSAKWSLSPLIFGQNQDESNTHSKNSGYVQNLDSMQSTWRFTPSASSREEPRLETRNLRASSA